MPRYIDADKTKDVFHHKTGGCMFDSFIDDIPTADVEEVKHGKWITRKSIHNEEFYVCSACATANDDIWQYCPYCGAKMDGTPKERGGEK